MKAILLCLILIQVPVFAADLDEHEQKGLHDTQKLLKTPSKRQEYFKNDKRAKDVDDKVGALAGTAENKEEIYDLASQLMERITVEAKGDPQKMQTLLMEAQQNPQAFYEKYFSEKQKAAVRGLANKIEKQKTPVGPAK